MAGTVVVTEEKDPQSISKITFAFTTDGSTGAADAVTREAYQGKVELVEIIPGGVTPTNAFDVAVTDGDGVDVLLGNGVDMSNSATTIIKEDYLGACAGDVLTLAVTNAGNSKTGKVILYVR